MSLLVSLDPIGQPEEDGRGERWARQVGWRLAGMSAMMTER